MGINYDAWLEKPYQDLYENDEFYERGEEEYPKSDHYAENLDYWMEETGKTEADYLASEDYTRDVERYGEYLIKNHKYELEEQRWLAKEARNNSTYY